MEDRATVTNDSELPDGTYQVYNIPEDVWPEDNVVTVYRPGLTIKLGNVEGLCLLSSLSIGMIVT